MFIVVRMNTSSKTIRTVIAPPAFHWVGDGFKVKSMFGGLSFTADISPFLMMDYGGLVTFPPTDKKLGVGQHPHRGFETVTIVYDGEVEHGDSVGNRGTIGPGEVQWMTAAAGIVHEEFHGRDFAARGGAFEMVQLWVNLPAKDKMAPPRYQALTRDMISEVALPGGGTARLIAGDLEQSKGAALTFTAMNVWDVRLPAGTSHELKVPEGHGGGVLVLRGTVHVAGTEIGPERFAVISREGEGITLTATTDATVLLLSGTPIDEPIVAHGPFVMNTQEEIRTAFEDYRAGRMGRVSV